MQLESIRMFTAYHIDLTRRVWQAIDSISDAQFLEEQPYSRGSLRNLMMHLVSTDRRWLAGLKNQADVGHLKLEDYATRRAGRAQFESVAAELAAYVEALPEAELSRPASGMPNPRWQILLHIVNHGTDHRATALQMLAGLGVPTFDQDFIVWLWSRK